MAAIDSAALWAQLKHDPQGLVTAVVQHHATGKVLMVGHMNAAALAHTLATGRVTFWSRSRACLWQKGETSGNTLVLQGMWVDCDGDALLVAATPHGPTCHTGAESCFFTAVASEGRAAPTDVIANVFAEVCARKAGQGLTSATGRSYVRELLAAGVPAVTAKLHEEAAELAEAVAADDPDHTAREAADLVFHILVALAAKDIPWSAVTEVLARRTGRSGIDEKAARAGV